MTRLDRRGLHASLDDPVLGSIGFLNEVMARYPHAISFAPGAPHPRFLAGFDPAEHLDRYVEHLSATRGRQAAWRLLLEYGPSRGLIGDLVAHALANDQQLDVPAEAVVITVGAQEAMLLALRVLFRSEADLLAVADPCFVGIVGAARLLDVGVVPVAETDRGLDLAGLVAACRTARSAGKRVRALYVAPDFANPSGTVLDLAARYRLLELAEREDFLVLEDNAYGFTAQPGHEVPTLKQLDRHARVLLIGTFAKVCLPGARVGFVVADQTVESPDGPDRLLADEIAAAKTMVTVNTSPLCQAVIGGMLLAAGGSIAALAEEKSAHYRENLAHLLGALDRHLTALPVRWNRPRGGFFARLRLPVPADLALLDHCATKYGVVWTPMSQFHLGGARADEIRLSASYLDHEQIDEGIARLARFLRDHVGA